MVEWHLKVIFFLLTSPKFDFVEVEKAMFLVATRLKPKNYYLVVARYCDVIFCFLISSKFDLYDVEDAIFQFVECHFEFILCLLTK